MKRPKTLTYRWDVKVTKPLPGDHDITGYGGYVQKPADLDTAAAVAQVVEEMTDWAVRAGAVPAPGGVTAHRFDA
ncbi:hypothetical protein [Streptomyces omiyaensis]|uniref:hypothetical protein n=1 Tax=Streptomyces omiyaensis TaxID=68247 RepID=UPI003701A90A